MWVRCLGFGLAFALFTLEGMTPPARAASGSTVTRMTVAGTQSVGMFGGTPYTRTWGTLYGVVAPTENVAGLDSLTKNADGNYEYRSDYEIIAPTTPSPGGTLFVEAENRGNPLFIGRLDDIGLTGAPSAAKYPPGLGSGFLQNRGTAYARVQWQTGIATGVPASAQGVGEVIVRDFARRLSTDYHTLILGGISQAGWFVETFVAEGFNENPADGHPVFNGAIAIDGTGHWLAINQLGAANKTPQQPYVDPKAPTVLSAQTLLRRPNSDPFFIDVANYTDFYRVQASLTDHVTLPANMRRYDWPSPHATGTAASAANAFSTMACNGGTAVRLNPIPYNAYLRAVTLELERQLGAKTGSDVPPLPPTTLFTLGPVPAAATEVNNPLAGTALQVPVVDADAQPVGGVRFPEVEQPVGKPVPVSLSPVITTTIANTCGNLGGWQPFTADQLAQRYQNASTYVNRYAAALDKLIASGYVLPSDRAKLLAQAAALYAKPEGY
jgi:hypothetical protein